MTDQAGLTGPTTTDGGASVAAGTAQDATDVVEAAGHFRIYLGAAAGVGKTYAMLNEGRRGAETGAPTWSSGSWSATGGGAPRS